MLRKLLFILLLVSVLNPSVIYGEPIKKIELFDIQKDTVTDTVSHNPLFQKAALQYFNGINQIFVKVKPIPKTGYMIRIPLDPAISVKNEWINELVDEVIIILTKDDQPYLMIFDDENNPHFFYFKGNTDIITKTFNITL